jgi:molybdopterin converting factor small subunit
MKITVKYLAQVKQAAGASSEVVDVARPCHVAELIAQLTERHGEPLRRLLLDDDGKVQPALLLFVGEEQVDSQTAALADGDVVTVLAPMAGG